MIDPLGARVVIRQLKAEETTKSGLIVPEVAKEKPQIGEIMAIGEGIESVKVQVGSKVLFAKYAGHDVTYDGVEYIIIMEENLLAILKEEE